MDSDAMKELLARRARLDAKIARHRSTRRLDVLRQIVRLIREYDISPSDIDLLEEDEAFGGRPVRKAEPCYRDPKTGLTWSGRGRPPRWIAGRDPEDFRIAQADAPANVD
ncbi:MULTISPECIES: H-NS family nucleoid-associated regulatory protein [Burkholderia cepacia complex]|uniref:DNA-binding protein H-NS-like C-terminal domain-containing protein n=1 Tax=Burkholderia ubonensis TaxID=101571 RepID=A0A1B4LHQ4_9BURK|nr:MULTISPECIES: H-NS histone family protein [Burkholderia cepacia complex]AOJ76674.1 hypothetical protein WJ35_16430 [Burkholderia ubonensis]AOK13762.1 hypothetical protein WK31_25885 [Burkholderia vietnamiensis]KVF14432.1 hypothetical protein WJ05_07995 [Burkholderia vietnamiensis]KVG00351.1 hypothetical protein WJ21_10280 [Burkholderia vietnamiensis]